MLLEILAQPIFLRLRQVRIRILEVQLAVERNDVPAAEVVAVVSLAWRPSSIAEVSEVRIAAAAIVVVISGRGVQHLHDAAPPPRRREAARKVVR